MGLLRAVGFPKESVNRSLPLLWESDQKLAVRRIGVVSPIFRPGQVIEQILRFGIGDARVFPALHEQ